MSNMMKNASEIEIECPIFKAITINIMCASDLNKLRLGHNGKIVLCIPQD